jgi:hypothetical protein
MLVNSTISIIWGEHDRGCLKLLENNTELPPKGQFKMCMILLDAIKKNTETLIDASKEVGLEIHVEKTKYMLLSRHQNVG